MTKHPRWKIGLLCGALALPVCAAAQQVEELLEQQGGDQKPVEVQAEKPALGDRRARRKETEKNREKPQAQKRPDGKTKPAAPQKTAKGPKAAAGGKSKGGISGGIKVVTNPNNLKLRLLPEGGQVLQDIDVVEGTEFTTDVVLVNPVGLGVDKLRVVLDYGPAFLTPVSINDTPLSDRMAEKPSNMLLFAKSLVSAS